ncbi:hypothetical protein F5I97DRAFT_1827743 [Phlebopus sp. FC_14]|nr:hypothetical protein F5I97DRAFT_1827743 [Phlebopus sp. FC_14]
MNARVKHAMEVLRIEDISDDIKEARNMLKNYFATTVMACQTQPFIHLPSRQLYLLFLHTAVSRNFDVISDMFFIIITFSIHAAKERNTFRLVTKVYAEVVQHKKSFNEVVHVLYILLWWKIF